MFQILKNLTLNWKLGTTILECVFIERNYRIFPYWMGLTMNDMAVTRRYNFWKYFIDKIYYIPISCPRFTFGF
jgi:hypothetical protein